MIYTLARDVGAKLSARKFPVRVTYGPERLQREGYDPIIVIERDLGGSDRIGPAVGVQRNARKRMVRLLAVRATIYAVSTLPGAMIHDHERECERLIDALLVAVDEWQAAERAGALAISEARYLTAADRNDVETWPGVVYVLRFAVPRAVYALTYEGEAKPEAAAPGFTHAMRVSIDGDDYENVPKPNPAGADPINLAPGVATSTETALAPTLSKRLAVGVATETDAALAPDISIPVTEAIAAIVALGPVKFYYAGANYVTESGGVVSQWEDLSGNANHATQATEDDKPALVTNGDGTWLEWDKDDGSNGKSLSMPRPLSGAPACSVRTAYQRTTAGVASILWSFDNFDFSQRWSSGNVFQTTIGASNQIGSFTESSITPHIVRVDFDGGLADNESRLKVWLDGSQQTLGFSGTIPAALPVLSAGQIGRWATVQPLDGLVDFHVEFPRVLSESENAVVDAAQVVLLAWAAALVNPGTDLTESETILAVSATPVDETATGVTLTPGATVVAHDNGAPHVAFTTMAKEAGGTITLGFRKASTHGVDEDGAIKRVTSTDEGATWSAESTLIDTPGIDDRDPHLYLDGGGNLRVAWFVHSGSARQAFDADVATGSATNVSGFPLIPGANIHTAWACPYDDGDRFAIYGAPLNGSQLYRVGLVDRGALTLDWLKASGFNLYEPAILRIDVNTLLIVTRVATQAEPTGHVQMMLTRSTDNGATWSDWQKFSEIGDAPHLTLHSSGTVLLFYRRRQGPGIGDTFSTGVMWSRDGGLTWGAATDVYVHGTNDAAYPSSVELDNTDELVGHYEPRFIRVTPLAITIT